MISDVAPTVTDSNTVGSWTSVCSVDSLVPDRGVAVLVEDSPVALFLLSDESVHALDHHDPANGAPVMARGLVGCSQSVPYIASPLLKERYVLSTGQRMDGSDAPGLRTHSTRVIEGMVQVQVAS